MIGCVKKVNIDPVTQRNFHNVPIDTKKYGSCGSVLRNPDVVIFKDTIIKNFGSFLENNTKIEQSVVNYVNYMRITSNLHTIRTIVPYRAGSGIIDVIVNLQYTMRFESEIPISIARSHITQYYKYTLSSRLRRWLDMELFKCACQGISPFYYNWNRVVDLSKIHD